MTITKLKIAPGYVRDTTFYTNTGGWYDGDKMRFRSGLPEKIGGWQRYSQSTFTGTASDVFRWAALDGSIYTAVGTEYAYYLFGGSFTGFEDATPVVHTTAANSSGSSTKFGTNALATDNSTPAKSLLLTVTDPTYTPTVGQRVTLAGATGFNGVSADDINKEHEIVTVVDSSHYQVALTSASSGTGSGGGNNITATYLLAPGLATSTTNTGWGVGGWGGALNPFSVSALTNVFTTTLSSTTVRISQTAHGLSTGDYVIISGASSVGGIPAVFLNGAFYITYYDANSYDITVNTATAVPAISIAAAGPTGSATISAYKATQATGWGSAANGTGVAADIRIWSTDNFGEKIFANVRNGGVYHWSPEYGTTILEPLDTDAYAVNPPVVASTVLVSDVGQHLMAFGTNPWTVDDSNSTQDPLLVRWSDSENPYNWNEADTTALAGSIRLGVGSQIIGALHHRQEILVFTDSALYSMQYVGGQYIFVPTLQSPNITIIGPNAATTINNVAYWMGTDNFYYYDGTVHQLPCAVRDKIFLDINLDQGFKVYAGTTSEFNEVIWFYPSKDSLVNDRYVVYNYDDKVWYWGTLNRSVWLDSTFGEKPIASYTDDSDVGYLYSQETGTDDGTTDDFVPIEAWIVSSPVEIADGEDFAFVRRLLPDVTYRNTTGTEGKTITVSLYPQNYPGAQIGTGDPSEVNRLGSQSYDLSVYTSQVPTRIRGRSVIIRAESDGLEIAWRFGTPRLDIVQDGKR